LKTTHYIRYSNAKAMDTIDNETVDLVVTSPPYPMIAMWDNGFSGEDPLIASALESGDGDTAFERMHRQLDAVWQEVYRILKPGGIACINIGDATRSIGDRFRLFPNHSRVLSFMISLGFVDLPAILWRKPTNAPTKFMGSGMLPPGAYVTIEHEYILILRKGDRRRFVTRAEKERRRESAFFWEERNQWFSDVWLELKGAGQAMTSGGKRQRSAAYPFELPYRLISMFSVKEDLVVDPFLGTGSTVIAAMTAARNSIGYESDPSLKAVIARYLAVSPEDLNQHIHHRLQAHFEFVQNNTGLTHRSRHYGFPVKTRQETRIFLNPLLSVELAASDGWVVRYETPPELP